MNYDKREIILIVGLLLFMVGLFPFTSPFFAAIIVSLMYVGIKVYVSKRKRLIQRDAGEGICFECGSKIHHKKCPNCG
jgi:hypothetical protein